MTKPRLYVALPWLEDAVRDAHERRSLPDLPALEWLASRGTILPAPQDSWRHWLLQQAGAVDARQVLAAYPAGPCIAVMADMSTQDPVGAWACAQPVHLAAAIDHLRLAPLPQAELNTADRAALAASINAHLGDRGFRLEVYVDGAWLLRCANAVECQSHDPALVAGHNIHDYMPSGPHGALVRSLMNEIQMVLHEHPVNESRVSRNEPVINALWLWGFGAALPVRRSVANAAQLASKNETRGHSPFPGSRPGRRESVPGGSARNVLLRDGPAVEPGNGKSPPVSPASAVSELISSGPATELGGAMPPRIAAGRDVTLLADDPWLRAIWHLHGRETTAWTPLVSTPGLSRDSCIAVSQAPGADTATALVGIGSNLLEPLRSALAAGKLGGLELLIGSRVLVIEASARFKFWRRASTVARLVQ